MRAPPGHTLHRRPRPAPGLAARVRRGRPAPDRLPRRRRARRPHAVGHRDGRRLGVRRRCLRRSPASPRSAVHVARAGPRSGRPPVRLERSSALSRWSRRVDRVLDQARSPIRPGGAGPGRRRRGGPRRRDARPASALPLLPPTVRAARRRGTRNAVRHGAGPAGARAQRSTCRRRGPVAGLDRLPRADRVRDARGDRAAAQRHERGRRRAGRRLVCRDGRLRCASAGQSLRPRARTAVRAPPRVRRRIT